MEKRIISDGQYTIEKHKEIDNIFFLMKDGSCVGGVDKCVTTINQPWDGETDVSVIYQGDDQARAVFELWEARWSAR